jgi:hypothetical protein
VLLAVCFLLFVTEALLALSIEKGQLDMKNLFTILLMYFTYTQIWILLVVNAFRLEIKRMFFREETIWYKTKRFR